MKKLLVLALCCFAALLPGRLRVLFSEALGWVSQFGYWVTFRIARILVRNLGD